MKDMTVSKVGRLADKADASLSSMAIPLPPALHLEGVRAVLMEIRDELRTIYRIETGEDPWV